jgi:hypothetical protein
MIILRTKILDQDKEVLALETPHIAVRSNTRLVMPERMLFFIMVLSHRSRRRSVIVVSGYGLDDRAIDVRSPAEAR